MLPNLNEIFPKVELVFNFSIPGVPFAKQRPHARVVAGRSVLYTPQKTLSYEGRVAYEFTQKYPNFTPLPPEGLIFAFVECFFPIPSSMSKSLKQLASEGQLFFNKKPDVDNIAKIIFDGLNQVAFSDDKTIVANLTIKRYSLRPRVDVKLYKIVK